MYYWKKINIILTIALLLLLIPSVISLLMPGLIVTDDATWMVIRLSAFFDSLKDGQIPVRILERLNNGYGYPVSNFLYPGFLYISSAIHILGFGFVDSIKIILILSMILSGIFSYLWLKKIFDPAASFIGSLFYVYAPYHLYDLYKRGSVGEILAFVWIPFILWQIERKSLHFVSFGVFLLVISHNSLAMLSLPLIILYSLLQKKGTITILGGFLGLLMSSFFIIPAIFELQYTKFNSTAISNPFEYFASVNLIGYSSIVVLAALLIVIVMLKGSIRFMTHKSLLVLFMFFSFTGIFLSMGISRIIWEIIPSQFIQFPYRMLSLLIISISFIAAFVIAKLKSITRLVVSFILLVALCYSASFYVFAKERTFYPDGYYSTNMDTTTVKDEYMPKWVVKKPATMPNKKIEVVSGSAEIQIISINSKKVEIDLKNSSNSVIRINQIYYPGWKAYMNNEQIDITYDNVYGAMDVAVSRGGGRLILVFRETPLRYISDTMSVVAILFGLLLLLRPILKFR